MPNSFRPRPPRLPQAPVVPSAKKVSALVRGAAVYELFGPLVFGPKRTPRVIDRVIVSSALGETRVFPTHGEIHVLATISGDNHRDALAALGFEVTRG